MPATMDKKDVKISIKNPKSANWTQAWTQIQQCSGKPIPSVAKESVQSAVGNTKYKALAVKVGLIKKDLYLRIKDGSKHIQDVKLVTNWTPPKGWVDSGVEDDEDSETISQEDSTTTTEPIDPNYERNLQAWKQGKENCKRLGEQAVQTLQGLVRQADNWADRAQVEAERACVGQDITNTALPNAQEAVQDIQNLSQQADTAYQRFFVEFDRHRTGEKGEDFKREDKEGYGMAFFMQVLKPLYQNATNLKDSIATHLATAQAAVAQIIAYQQNGPQQAFLLKAQSIHQQTDDLLQKSRTVLGGMTGDISQMVTKGSGLAMDLESVMKATAHEMKLANADKALQRLTGIREAMPRMDEFLKQGKLLANETAKIPKNLRTGQIKQELDAGTQSLKELLAYHQQWRKHAETAEKIYKEILKLVNK